MSPRGSISPAILLSALLWPVAPCPAQIENPVYVDDSPQAWLLFQQAQDQTKDNLGEAVRLYQELLIEHGIRLIPVSRNTQDHFASVRSRVLTELLTNKALLDRYRLIESAQAQRLFQDGQLSLLSQTRPWTEPGLDALLLLGQSYLEASQFQSALHQLREALRHPDLRSEREQSCWHMIGIASHYLGDTDTLVKARQRLSEIEGGAQPRLAHLQQMIAAGKGPASIRGISTLDRTDTESLQSLIAEDIWSIDLTDSLLNRRYRKDPNDPSLGREVREQRKRRGIMNTASPTIAGERVFINEGHTIRAFDRFTGRSAWDKPYSDLESVAREDTNADLTFDMNIVTVKNNRLVTLTGHLLVRGRSGKGKVVCLDATTGEPQWICDISRIDKSDEFERMFPYGAPIIEDGMVFILARKVRKQQLTACYVIALNLETGNTHWIQHINTSGGVRGSARPFSTLASDRGSLYVASPLGAIARIEPHDGEIRWLRRYSVPLTNSQNNLHMPWEFDQPVIMGKSLITILPNRRRVAVLSLETGDELESYPCTSRDGWSAPKYLLGNEDMIYAVGRNVVAFRFDNLSLPIWRLTPPTTDPLDGNSFLEQRLEIRGRIQLAQDSLIVPTLYGIRVVDDVTGRLRHTLKTPNIGNPVAVDSQLLLASSDRLDAFMSFSRAEEMLRERIDSSPLDPNPGLSLLRLAIRVRDFKLSIESASIVIGVMNRLEFDASMSETHSELFARLLEVNESGIPVTNQEGEQLFGLISSVADNSSRRIEYLLSYGSWLGKHSPQHAIEQGFQAILSDPNLASSWRSRKGQIRTASDWALDEQQSFIRKHGPDVYAPQSAFARLRLDQVSQSSPPEIEALSELISEFPLSSAAAAASITVAETYFKQGDTRSALGVLTTAYLADPGRDEAGVLLGTYAMMCESEGWSREELSLLNNLRRLKPDLQIEMGDNSRTARRWIKDLDKEGSLTRPPTIGSLTPDAIFLDGSLVPFVPDVQRSGSNDLVLLRDDEKFKLFRISDLRPNNPMPVWTTIIEDVSAKILRFTDQELILWFGTGENTDHPKVIMLDTQTGEQRWRSPDMDEFLDGPSGNLRQFRPAKEQMPNDKTFDPRLTIPLINSKTIIVVQSMGSIMAFDLENSESELWQTRILINQVHMVQLTDSELIIAGQIHKRDALGATLIKSMQIMVLDPRTGELLHKFSPLGNTGAKWMATGIMGTLIYGTRNGIELFDLHNGRRRWANISGGARDSQDKWLINDRLVIQDRDGYLRTVMLQDGTLSPPFNSTVDKNDSPLDLLEVLASDDGIVARYRNRIVRLSLNGDLLGADAITALRNYQWLLSSKNQYLLINARESRQRVVNGQNNRRIEHVYELYLLSKNGQILDGPSQIPRLLKKLTNAMLLNDWLMISTRDQTFAIHIPTSN